MAHRRLRCNTSNPPESVPNTLKLADSSAEDKVDPLRFITRKADPLVFIRDLVKKADESDKGFADGFVKSATNDASSEVVFLLLEIAFYYDNIGDADKAVSIAKVGIDLSNKLGERNLQRKAHNTAGALLSSICDFEQACFHLEKALTIAKQLQDDCLEFAALCNVVTVLRLMGLYEDARNLAVKLSVRPGDTADLDYLHLQNAINGSRSSDHLDDLQAADYFNTIARHKLLTAGSVGRTWKVYVDAYEALCLIKKGRGQEAHVILMKALGEQELADNSRINVVLYCAYGYCALANNNTKQIENAKTKLVNLLEQSKKYALDRENVLRALVELYAADKSRSGKAKGLKFVRQLSHHLVNVKHRQFFERVRRPEKDDNDSSPKTITRPFYKISGSLAAATIAQDRVSNTSYTLQVCSRDEVQSKKLQFYSANLRKIEERHRSDFFDMAEDWALAADFLTDRAGSHCFEVGIFAGLVARHLGMTEERCVLIEMACRLHDIGKLTVGGDLQRLVNSGSLDAYPLIMEHVMVGCRLLDSSPNVVLQMASSVARYHHEWWNGCGLPNGLQGIAIPIEARICALADAYLVLLNPSFPQIPWADESALRQIESMAGVQLDPNLMNAFFKAAEQFVFGEIDARCQQGQLRPSGTPGISHT